MRSPMNVCTMCTSAVAVADALPAQPEMRIGDSTVERSAIGKSLPLVPTQPVGLGDGVGVGVGVGWSSLTIVPTAWPSTIVALPVAPVRATLNVASGSTVPSPLTCTVAVLD